MKKTSSFEMGLSVAVILQGAYFLLSGFILQNGQQSCLPGIALILVAFLCLLIWFKAFKFESLFDMPKNAVVKIILWLYVLFFVLLCAYNINALAVFVGGYVLDETPKILFTLFFVALCAFAAWGGEKGVLKLAAVFFLVAAASELINTFLLRERFNAEKFLPLLSENPLSQAGSAASLGLILAGEIVSITAFMSFREKGGRRSMLWGYILGSVFVLLTIVRTVAALGNTSGIFTWPTFEALRMIDSRNNLSRIETGSVFVILSTMFFKVSVLFCAALCGIKKLCHIKKDTLPVIFLAAATMTGGNVLFSSGTDLLSFAAKYGAFFALPFAALFPLYFWLKKKKNSRL